MLDWTKTVGQKSAHNLIFKLLLFHICFFKVAYSKEEPETLLSQTDGKL